MRIKVSVTVDVDTGAWSLEYGVPVDEVPADVRAHCENMVRGHLESLGVLTTDDTEES